MRRNIVHPGAGKLKYEIREIVAFARELSKWNIPIQWENIGDPVKKGEPVDQWIKDIVMQKAAEDLSYAYSETEGARESRDFLAEKANQRKKIGGPGDPDPALINAGDILFFNGLGDAVAKVFGFLRREARVLGPSPAYSTLSSAEAAHSGYEHLTYRLDPERSWMPDMADVELKVRYNDSIAGILLINPDNPTGAVYPVEVLREFVRIARTYGLFIVCDETYANIVYGGAETAALSQVIGDVPGLSLRSISKEVPWPGARCGWIEVYNRKADPWFDTYIQSLVDAKRLEVCSTSLPQLCIPAIMGDARYPEHLTRRAAMFEKRAEEAYTAFADTNGISLVKPRGALYATAIFDAAVLHDGNSINRSLPVSDPSLADFIREKTADVAPDKRFVYWLLASTGICVVPLSGFASELPGFRFTLLEHDDEKRRWIYKTIADSVRTYLESVPS
ncbi:pyridoxal phosphate-dependent aminotransferase [Breznakiella homolactica]|uniref:alanine transaminase n=1 Tax=Breznakiella homolactica TaxID=2798577 RepID=A0A7T7XML4_9SPIR|nr:pyridoxal phosphate-dependent aminotransferase [Breznakiella homolactica]QQO09071.1 pyridoxal phosphate-dependent aminotransferase [Breznakiella homolactica]